MKIKFFSYIERLGDALFNTREEQLKKDMLEWQRIENVAFPLKPVLKKSNRKIFR
jgi:hypothetical protein